MGRHVQSHKACLLIKQHTFRFIDRFIVVEWRNVQLNDENHHGQFTFQSKLFQNGTIMFIYKTVPVTIDKISTSNHSVKLGVSDAFYYDVIKNGVKYRIIRRYHSVPINITMIKANTVVILDPLPTCNTFTGCHQCVSANIDFECSWCPKISTCSNGGLDWNLQKWYDSRCNETAGNTSSICPTTARPTTDNPNTPVIVVPVVLILVIVGLVGGWIYYAYTRPNTASGQWLIERGQTARQLKTSFAVKFKRSNRCKLVNEDN